MPSDRNRNFVGDDWYREKRRQVETQFVESHLISGSETIHLSPSGRYRLVTEEYVRRPQTRNYSRGRVYEGERLIGDVKRNLDPFCFAWAEGHRNGHDYLLCGEDYQGQTVIELDTGRRMDHIHESARGGGGFCCAAYYPSPDRKLVVIDGCIWAGPSELLFCRFDDPMSLPWPQFDRIELGGEVEGWSEKGFVYESSEDIRITDGKPFEELSDDEQEEFWKKIQVISGVRIRRYLRFSTGESRLLDERTKPVVPVIPAKAQGKQRQCSGCSATWQQPEGVRYSVCPNCGQLTEVT